MGKKRSYQQYCSLARALDIIGERWTLLIVRDLLGGPRRYKDLQESLDGIGSNLLAARARTLEPTVASLAHWGLDLLAAPRQNDHWQPQWNHVALKARFNPQEAAGLSATYAFEIGGYPHYAVVKDGALATFEGTAPNPDLLLKASDEDFLRVVEGELNLKEAIQSGLISVEGSGESLLRMAKVFTPEQS